MRASRRRLLFSFSFALVLLCFGLLVKGQAQIPGLPGNATDAALGRGVSENKLGSVLFFNYYTSEVNRIQAEMQAKGLVEIGFDGTLIPKTQYVMTVVVDPIWAQAGRINVVSDQLQGSGRWIAPSDASVADILEGKPRYSARRK